MSPNLDSTVQTQMAVAALNRPLNSESDVIKNSEGRSAHKRRVFVQTDTGCVLSIELDRGDNAHTVKRKLHIALNVPIEESSLTFGDIVLKNDLSAVRNDSPLLLTRNLMHRSSSSPCLSPTGKDLQLRDRSEPIEILGCLRNCSITKQLVKSVVTAIKSDVDPITIQNGLGGAYYFRDNKGERIAIVKPTDEEPFAPNNPKGFTGKSLGQPGLKKSVRVGETGFREVAAYLLDHNHFANVPPTALVKITHPVFNVFDGVSCDYHGKLQNRNPNPISKIASFQQYIPHDFDASDHGTSSFPVSAVHRIGILDVRIFNTDRHSGNLLVRRLQNACGKIGGQVELIPIDHGLCLPETLDDPYFEWIHWPQASIPFCDEELEYIANLDPVGDSDMLRMELPMIREACLRVLMLCTIFLKEAAAFGLCLAEIGEMMSRQFTGSKEEPSQFEVVCMEARRLISELGFSLLENNVEEEIQFDIDCEATDPIVPKPPPGYHIGKNGGREGDHNTGSSETIAFLPIGKQHINASELSVSLNVINLTEKTNRYNSGFSRWDKKTCKTNNNICGSRQGWSRSAYGQLPLSANFVNLADMALDEWGAFLEKFQELIVLAFRGWSCRSVSQRQRLGTSCQF
ncbi:hypothetical protein HPP92_018526 [Vanilla planifolia]|uniref:1-phosphatidylinositol 4-kinase n=1 Tax=Vanilla planifolia TaxID=51239 RepID=A0A835QD56_VANPL|nr:hypothetical protein HPP92_018526 [Vanilla planifolia]